MSEMNYITREEHTEFATRMEESRARQNARLADLEESVKQINNLAISVEKLALSVQTLAEAQKDQSERLETIEKRDGEKWRTAMGYVLTAVMGAIFGLLIKQLGL